MDERVEAGLVDGDAAGIEVGDTRFVLVDAEHVKPEFGKAGAGHQPDISSSDDSYFHVMRRSSL